MRNDFMLDTQKGPEGAMVQIELTLHCNNIARILQHSATISPDIPSHLPHKGMTHDPSLPADEEYDVCLLCDPRAGFDGGSSIPPYELQLQQLAQHIGVIFSTRFLG